MPARIGQFTFPVGYERFHPDQLFNFQLNRPYSLGYARFEDLAAVGRRIASFAQWKTEMRLYDLFLRLFNRAFAEHRIRRDRLSRHRLRRARPGRSAAKGVPLAALEFAMALNEENLHSGAVEQDFLILASRDDHFIPFRLHQQQLSRLTGARSVTDRVFTREDQAQNHCQIDNLGLALWTMRTGSPA